MAKPEFKIDETSPLDFFYEDGPWNLSLKFIEYRQGSSHNTGIYQVVLTESGNPKPLKSEKVSGMVAAKKTGKAWIDLARTRCL